MYGIFTDIYHKFDSKYTIHGMDPMGEFVMQRFIECEHITICLERKISVIHAIDTTESFDNT